MSWPFDNASIRHDKQFQSKCETSIKHLATQTTLRQVTTEVKPCTSDASRLQIWQILTRKRSQQHAPKSNNRWNKKNIHTEAGMLSGISRKHNMRSSSCRYTEFCNSQCLSHFAAPFIVVRTETSVAESCKKNWMVRTIREQTNSYKWKFKG